MVAVVILSLETEEPGVELAALADLGYEVHLLTGGLEVDVMAVSRARLAVYKPRRRLQGVPGAERDDLLLGAAYAEGTAILAVGGVVPEHLQEVVTVNATACDEDTVRDVLTALKVGFDGGAELYAEAVARAQGIVRS